MGTQRQRRCQVLAEDVKQISAKGSVEQIIKQDGRRGRSKGHGEKTKIEEERVGKIKVK